MRSTALLLAAAVAVLAPESAGAPSPSQSPSPSPVLDAEGAAVRRPLSQQQQAELAAQAARRLKGFSGGRGASSWGGGVSSGGGTGSSDGGIGTVIFVIVVVSIFLCVFFLLLVACLAQYLKKKPRKAGEQLNDEGAPVYLSNGDGAEKYYCGRTLGTDKIPGSDGRCGPNSGPQCESCSRFKDAVAILAEYLEMDKQNAEAKKQLLNDEGAPVFLGNNGAEKYYCGRMLGTDKIPGSDGWCGPNGGPQCQSCSRFRGAEETKKEVVNGAEETNKEVTVEVVNEAEETNKEVTVEVVNGVQETDKKVTF